MAERETKPSRVRRFGPGFLVTAAFVGPGTIATASQAGSGFGYLLLWAVLFSVLATMVLQEMAGRLGVITRYGLSESLRVVFRPGWRRWTMATLVIVAILFGNTAYQAGNLTGAAQGIQDLSGVSAQIWAIPIALVAWGLLLSGKFRLVQLCLVTLVALMSALFIVSAVLIGPSWSDILRHTLVPTMPLESLGLVIALIGTTVVPYNLFLHSSAAAATWRGADRLASLRRSRIDLFTSVLIGGLITSAIVVSAAVAFAGQEETRSLGDIAEQLTPVLGDASHWLFGLGLFAAGLTSAITAPLAAAYATTGCLGWSTELTDRRFRIIFSLVIGLGLIICLIAPQGTSPGELIVLAQIANGLLLPLIAVFLLLVMNSRQLLGRYANGVVTNVLGIAVVLLATGLGVNQIFRAITRLAHAV